MSSGGGTDVGESGRSLASVVDELCRANDALLGTRRRKLGRQMLPSREAVASIIRDLTAVFFPGHFGAADLSDEGMHYFIGHTLDSALITLEEQVRRRAEEERSARRRALRLSTSRQARS